MNHQPQVAKRDWVAVIFIATIAVAAVNATTLFLSYNVLATDAWLEHSSGTRGALIEFIRGVLIYAFLMILVTGPFNDDALRFFAIKSDTQAGIVLQALRGLLGLLLIIIAVAVSYHHFSWGPNELREKADNSRVSQQAPFIPYFFYSLLQYFIAATVWSLWLYGSYRDAKRVIASREILHKRKSPGAEFCEDFQRKLLQYQDDVETTLSRHPVLFTFVAILLLFEYLFGLSSLQSNVARELALLTYGLFAVILIGLVGSLGFFYREIRNAKRVLLERNCSVDEFHTRFGIGRIWHRFRVTLGGQLLVWAATTAAAIFKNS